jgi:hypothetical protein
MTVALALQPGLAHVLVSEGAMMVVYGRQLDRQEAVNESKSFPCRVHHYEVAVSEVKSCFFIHTQSSKPCV